jgi:hypothetical protein
MKLDDMEAQAVKLDSRLRIGWLEDDHGYVGGAELTAQQFALEKPDNVDIVRVGPRDTAVPAVDAWIVHNCVTYSANMVSVIKDAPVVKYVHDVWPHGDPLLRGWLLNNAYLVFTSPIHLQRFPWRFNNTKAQPVVVPPAMPLQAFVDAKNERAEGHERRHAALYVAHHGKGQSGAEEWARENNMPLVKVGIDREGGTGRVVPYDKMPHLMASCTDFVHRPDQLEPFGRTVVEAWAAGCNVHINENVGAAWWIAAQPNMLAPGKAGETFWRGVTALAANNL